MKGEMGTRGMVVEGKWESEGAVVSGKVEEVGNTPESVSSTTIKAIRTTATIPPHPTRTL